MNHIFLSRAIFRAIGHTKEDEMSCHLNVALRFVGNLGTSVFGSNFWALSSGPSGGLGRLFSLAASSSRLPPLVCSQACLHANGPPYLAVFHLGHQRFLPVHNWNHRADVEDVGLSSIILVNIVTATLSNKPSAKISLQWMTTPPIPAFGSTLICCYTYS